MAQWFNLDAMLYYPYARFVKPSVVMPHFSVPDIRSINPHALYDAGFKGVVFDKDNTLTRPYVLEIYEPLQKTFDSFRDVFGIERLCIMSNSAGTRDDKDYLDASTIEEALGVTVLRHHRKKPGGIQAVVDYFKCDPAELVMVGDRLFTDIAFGNRYGMLTIHTQCLTEEGDLGAAVSMRRGEVKLLEKLHSKRFSPLFHERHKKELCSK